MKQLAIFLLLPLLILLPSCSEDDEKVELYMFYVIKEDIPPCLEELVRKDYDDESELSEFYIQQQIATLTRPHFKELKKSEVDKVQKELNEEAAQYTQGIDCLIKYVYKKIDSWIFTVN